MGVGAGGGKGPGVASRRDPRLEMLRRARALRNLPGRKVGPRGVVVPQLDMAQLTVFNLFVKSR